MTISVKNKTLFFIGVVFLIFAVILISALNIHQNKTLHQSKQNYYHSLLNSYDKVLKRQSEFYLHRIDANIHSKGVIEAFERGDRTKLYELSIGRWKTLQKENPNLIIMHFHRADGTSFLRMHAPDHFGDKIADTRGMVKQMHHNQKTLFGYEIGKAGIAFRIFAPITSHGKYIGALEFGFKPDQVFQDLKYYHEFEGALFVHSKGSSNTMNIDGYSLECATLSQAGLLNHIKKIQYHFMPIQQIEYQEKLYNVYSFDIYDFQKSKQAKALFFQDITSIKTAYNEMLLQSTLFISGLLAIVMLFIEIGFRGTISTLDKTNQRLSENQEFLDSILHASSHAIIATDPNGVITLFNTAAEKMLGYTSHEMVDKKTPLIFHDPQQIIDRAYAYSKHFGKTIRPGFEVFVAKTLEGEDNNEFWTYSTKTGNKITVHLHISALKNKDNSITGYVGIAEDVTQEIRLKHDLENQKEELETILNTSKDGIAILDMTSKFLYANPAYLNMTGFTLEEIVSKSCIELSIPEDALRSKRIIEEVIAKGFVENFEKTCLVKNGKKITINMSIALMPDHQRVLIATKNVTRAKEIEREMNEYIRLIDENIITSSTDLEGNITYASEAFCAISGYTKEELLGQNHRIVRHPDMEDTIFKEIWETITQDNVWEGELKNKTKNDGYYWVYNSIYPTYKASGEKYGYTAIRQDITDKKKLQELAIRDGLTGIYNRRYFNEQFPKMIQSTKRSNEDMGFILLDIDRFKQYNDTYGHHMGDHVLIRVSETIDQILQRSDDLCFRLGGEEFGILFKPIDLEKAVEFADKIRHAIEELAIEHQHNSAASVVTVSMGLLLIKPSHDMSCESIYKYTDALLYQAKKEGRNRVSFDSLFNLTQKDNHGK